MPPPNSSPTFLHDQTFQTIHMWVDIFFYLSSEASGKEEQNPLPIFQLWENEKRKQKQLGFEIYHGYIPQKELSF